MKTGCPKRGLSEGEPVLRPLLCRLRLWDCFSVHPMPMCLAQDMVPGMQSLSPSQVLGQRFEQTCGVSYASRHLTSRHLSTAAQLAHRAQEV